MPILEWKSPGEKPKFKWMSPDDLQVDLRYQRREVSAHNTRKIAKEFSWTAFGALVVMLRDGIYYVVDGYQRLLSIKMRGDIKSVPCMITPSGGPRDEAEAFWRLNTHRKTVTPIHKYKLCVQAGFSPEREIERWLRTNHFKVDTGTGANVIHFARILITWWLKNPEASKSALLLQREICSDDSLHGSLHRGIAYLYANDIQVDKYTDKILKVGGSVRLLATLKALELEAVGVGKQMSNDRLFAVGILRVINKGKRSGKVQLPPLREALGATEDPFEDDAEGNEDD